MFDEYKVVYGNGHTIITIKTLKTLIFISCHESWRGPEILLLICIIREHFMKTVALEEILK